MAIICLKCGAENTSDSNYCKSCATQLLPSKESQVSVTVTLETPKEELTTGFTFADRYQIIEELGQGGMGRVYKALDKEVNERIAIKLLRPEIAADLKTIERFRNELKFSRKIGHKNVCRMYDLNKEENTYYITMEYVPGEDLKSFIKRSKQLTPSTIISIGKQVCEGLSEAHRLGVVHRDLKPQNIMIDKEGNARIMDFGIARSLKGKGVTAEGVIIGTPEYMSPEQVEAKEIDERSDIYSLGVVLYEMAAGHVPFEGETALSVAMKHKGELPKNPREFNPQIPGDLCLIVLKCLEKDKDRRYQSADELLNALKRFEESQTDRTRISEWKTSIAVLPFKNMSVDPEQEYFCEGLAEELINAFAQMRDLRVVARTSAFSFKGKDVDIRDIGRKLNVETVELP
jgi:serine/threonine protein kinase/ribosomal protein L40E